MNALYYHALARKRTKGWHNLQVTRDGVARVLAEKARLAAPPEVLNPRTPAHLRALYAAAKTLVEKALDAYYRGERERAEKARLVTYPLGLDDPNFPALTVRESSGPREVYAYELKVPESMLEEVDQLLADVEALREEARDFPLPRMYVSAHLYAPLLVDGKFDVGTGQYNVQRASSHDRVRSSPTGLVESEIRFLYDLRAFWEVRDSEEWGQTELFILRNLPRTGVGFFESAGFYPDFLVWLRDGQHQTLAFVDPKGLVRWNEEKVALLQTIRGLSEPAGFPLFGVIVTPTPAEGFSMPGVPARGVETYLAERNVLLQDSANYIREFLAPLLKSVQLQATGGRER